MFFIFYFYCQFWKKFFLLFTMFTVCLFNNQCFKCYSESFFLIIIKVVSVIQNGFNSLISRFTVWFRMGFFSLLCDSECFFPKLYVWFRMCFFFKSLMLCDSECFFPSCKCDSDCFYPSCKCDSEWYYFIFNVVSVIQNGFFKFYFQSFECDSENFFPMLYCFYFIFNVFLNLI